MPCYLNQNLSKGLVSTTSDTKDVVAALSALKALAAYDKDVYMEYDSKVLNFIVKQVLLHNDTNEAVDDTDWIEFEQLADAGKAKVKPAQCMNF